MKSKRNLPIYLSGLVLFSLLVSACGMLTSPTVQPGLIETAAAATVSARLTEMTFSTLVAKATQFAQATPSLMPAVNTATPAQPAATNTQVIISTNTQAPPANTPIPPTKTPVPLPCNWAGLSRTLRFLMGQSIALTRPLPRPGDLSIKELAPGLKTMKSSLPRATR